MCVGFVHKGRDLIAGYNLDLALGGWDYGVYAKKDMFYIGIKVGSTVYRTHGVNRNGNFANLPYMNAPDGVGAYRRGAGSQRLDLLVNGYIGGKLAYSDVLTAVREKAVVNVPNCSMHSLFSDADGSMLLVEPGLGCRELDGDFAVVSNFPIIEPPADMSPVYYGRDRYDICTETLRRASDGFTALDGLAMLYEARQEGEWATRVSFVYSRNEGAIYYTLNNDSAAVKRHVFAS